MSKLIDLTSKTFGRWTVIERGESRGEQTMWSCCCSCGALADVDGATLRNGRSESCGCARNELLSEQRSTICRAHKREYNSWNAMKGRCLRSNHHAFHNYGGRGITICEAWKNSFEQFFADMGVRPDNTSLDRIDNEGDYTQDNCRWADRKTQRHNSRHICK